jgi:hypothetical protein
MAVKNTVEINCFSFAKYLFATLTWNYTGKVQSEHFSAFFRSILITYCFLKAVVYPGECLGPIKQLQINHGHTPQARCSVPESDQVVRMHEHWGISSLKFLGKILVFLTQLHTYIFSQTQLRFWVVSKISAEMKNVCLSQNFRFLKVASSEANRYIFDWIISEQWSFVSFWAPLCMVL